MLKCLPCTYSIIIPFKGDVAYLEKLILSIPQRDDIEIIIIDNNTNHEKTNHLKGHKNINIIRSSPLKGAGYARNIGIYNCNGTWLLFADADDIFSKNAFDVFDNFTNSEYDVVYFKVMSYSRDKNNLRKRGEPYNLLIDNFLFRKTRSSLEKLRVGHIVPWGKMIRRSYIVTK